MKTTDYFQNKVLSKRPYLKTEWIERVLSDPEHSEIEINGRTRHWGYIEEIYMYVRVVVLDDGETVHNVFPDRRYKGERSK
jgi:hypothetical protein